MLYGNHFLFSIIILLISGQTALAQKTTEPKAPVQFGEVAKVDFSPCRDSAAAAEILCDYGQSGIVGAHEKFQVVFERVTRIRILRKSGYDWATVRVPLYVKDENKEKLSNLKGFTYNLVDGKVEKTKLDVSTGAFSEKVDKNHVLYSFTMPNVRAGAIVEFSYVIKSDFLFNLQDWQFQYDIPVRWSEYRVTLPAFFRYKQITRGYLPFAVQDQQLVAYHTTYQQDQQSGYGSVASAPTNNALLTTQALRGRWVLQDAPAFREEPYMTTARDYLRSVHFELAGSDFSSGGNEYHDVSGTWETITKRLLADEQFGGALQQNTPLLAVAQALRTVPDPRQRAAAVLHLVQQAVHYNGEETFYAAQSLRKVCEQHRGNAAEVNLLLLQALRAANLEANPLLLSTRHHGQIVTDLPLLTQFNYVVAHVALPDNPDLLLDATEPLAPLGVLPERCLNGQGRLLTNAGRWLPLTPQKTYLHYTNARLTLTDAGALQGTARLEYGGYAALEARQQVVDEGEAAYKTQLGRRWADWQLTTPPDLRQLKEPDKPFAVDLALTLPGADAPPATLYLPLMQAFGLSTNPFRHEDRFFPVDLGMAREYLQTVTLQLPASYVLLEKPADLALALPDNGGRFVYHVVQSAPGTLQITARLQLTKTTFPPRQYAALREFYSRALAKYGEMLVLQRK